MAGSSLGVCEDEHLLLQHDANVWSQHEVEFHKRKFQVAENSYMCVIPLAIKELGVKMSSHFFLCVFEEGWKQWLYHVQVRGRQLSCTIDGTPPFWKSLAIPDRVTCPPLTCQFRLGNFLKANDRKGTQRCADGDLR